MRLLKLTEALKVVSQMIKDRPEDTLIKMMQVMAHPTVEAYIDNYQKTSHGEPKEQLLTMFAIGVLVGEEIEK